jgi:hypothetical protein
MISMRTFNMADPDSSWHFARKYCRKAQRAVTVIINSERWILAPNGDAWKLGD